MPADNAPQLYPIKLTPVFKEKVWGGHKLNPLFGGLAGDGAIGEAWLVWEGLQVANGAWQGQTLQQLIDRFPLDILGSAITGGAAQPFPLLAKFLDTTAYLSIQVHPDDAFAQAHEGQPFGKYEVWYILDAEPGAQILQGLNRTLTRAELRAAIDAGKLTDILCAVDVHPGDVISNPPGTIHAVGKGITLFELQQSSDLTYRLYDWGRGGSRELHIDKSVAVSLLDALDEHILASLPMRADTLIPRTTLAESPYFIVDLMDIQDALASSTGGKSFHIITVLSGEGSIEHPGSDPVTVRAGESVLIPAALSGYEVRASGKKLTVVLSSVPER